MALSSALAQEGVSRVSSFISTKLDDRASRAHLVARLEMALSRLEFVLEWSRKQPITYVSLLRRRKMLKNAYMKGAALLIKHKQQVQEGHEEAGQLVTSSSYLERIIATAAEFSISSLAGLNKQQCLSSSVVQIFDFEWYAGCGGEFVADVQSGCPLRRDTFFRYPFVRQLLQGKTLIYKRVKGREKLNLFILPLILEGRGVEAVLWYHYFNAKKLDKSFSLGLALRLSESTDIVGVAIYCLRSSLSLLNLLVSPDAVIGELALLSNLQDISESHAPPWVGFEDWYASVSKYSRPDPLCCKANGIGPSVMMSSISSEQTICFNFSCCVSALEYSFQSASDMVVRNVTIDGDGAPLKLEVSFLPQNSSHMSFALEAIGGSKTGEERPFGIIQRMVDMIRSRSVDCLIRQPKMKHHEVSWLSNHGFACFNVEGPRIRMAAVPKASGRYNTRNAAKRKR